MTNKGKDGEEVCRCGGELEVAGAYQRDGRFHTDKFRFFCRICREVYIGSADDVETLQDVSELRQLQSKIKSIRARIRSRTKSKKHE